MKRKEKWKGRKNMIKRNREERRKTEGRVERRKRERNKSWKDSGTSFPILRSATYFFLRGRRLASWRYERRQSHHTPSAAQSTHAKTETQLLPRGTEMWYAPYQCNHGLVRQVYGQSSWLCRIKPSLGTDLPAGNGGGSIWN